MTWAEIKSQMLNRLSHPGTPLFFIFWFIFIFIYLLFLERVLFTVFREGEEQRKGEKESFFFFLKNFFLWLFIFERETDRQSTRRGRAEREGDRESEAGSRLLASAQSLMWGSNPQPWDHDQSWSRTLNQPSHPGAPGRERILSRLADSTIVHSPMWGSISWPWDHNLSRNQELVA